MTAGKDFTVKVWDTSHAVLESEGERKREEPERLLVLDDHAGEVFSVEFSPDGRELLTGGLDGQTIVYRSDFIPARFDGTSRSGSRENDKKSEQELQQLRDEIERLKDATKGFDEESEEEVFAYNKLRLTVELWDWRGEETSSSLMSGETEQIVILKEADKVGKVKVGKVYQPVAGKQKFVLELPQSRKLGVEDTLKSLKDLLGCVTGIMPHPPLKETPVELRIRNEGSCSP